MAKKVPKIDNVKPVVVLSVAEQLQPLLDQLNEFLKPQPTIKINQCATPDVDISAPFKCVDEVAWAKKLEEQKVAEISKLEPLVKTDMLKETSKNMGPTMVIAEGCVDEVMATIDDIKNMVMAEYRKFEAYHDEMRTLVPNVMSSFLYAEFYATAIARAVDEAAKIVATAENLDGKETTTSDDSQANAPVKFRSNPLLIPDYESIFHLELSIKPITEAEKFPQDLMTNWITKIKAAQTTPTNYVISEYTTIEVDFANNSLISGYYTGGPATSEQIEKYASTTDFKEKIKKNIYEVFADMDPIQGPDIYKWQTQGNQNNYTGFSTNSYLKPPVMGSPDLDDINGTLRKFITDSPGQPSGQEAENYMQIRKNQFLKYLSDIKTNFDGRRKPIYEVVNTAIRRDVIRSDEDSQKEHFALLKQHIDVFNAGLEKIQWYVNFYNRKYLEDLVNAKLAAATICGQKLPLDPTPDTTQTIVDVGFIGFSQYPDLSDVTKLKYWKKYSVFLNLVALIPIHWTTGLVVAGTSIKLPITWLPLVAMKTPRSVLVLFLTFNGAVVFPVLYEFVADHNIQSPSYLRTLLRGINTLIKNGTGSEALQNVVGNIIPPIEKPYTMIKDDLPIRERLDMTNLPYLKYLNDWCRAATVAHGITP